MSSRSFELRIVGPVALLTIALGACSSGSIPTEAPGTTAPSTVPSQATRVPSTPSATPPASPTAEPSSGLRVLPDGAQVGPGTYGTRFEPALTLTLDHSGGSDADIPGWIDIEYEGDTPFEIGIVRLDKVVDPRQPWASAVQNPPARLIDPPKDLAAWVERLPWLTVVAPATKVKVGGIDATQLDIRTEMGVPFGPIPGKTDIGAGTPPRTLDRLILLRVEGRAILIVIHSHEGFADFEAATTAFQPLIDSIVWH